MQDGRSEGSRPNDGAAREAYRGHDYAAAADLAARIAQDALERRELDVWWDNAVLSIHALAACGRFDLARDRALTLTRHPDGRSALRRAEAWTLASQNARHEGVTQPRRAVGYAETALSLLRELDLAASPELRGRAYVREAEALIAFIGAAVGCEDLELAEVEVPRLREIFDELPIGQPAALAAWVLGTMDYAAGRLSQGEAFHSVCEQLLDPRADLRTWGRFHKAAAFARLDAGLTEDVGRHLATARPILRFVGNNEDVAELAIGEARFRIRTGDLRGALDILAEASEAVADAPPRYRADIERWRSTTLEQLGDLLGAAEAARAAAQLYRLAGHDSRADDALANATQLVRLATAL